MLGQEGGKQSDIMRGQIGKKSLIFLGGKLMTPLILTGGGKKFTWQWACGKDSVVLIAILIHLMALDEESGALFIQFHLDVHRLVIHLEVNLKQGQEKGKITSVTKIEGFVAKWDFLT